MFWNKYFVGELNIVFSNMLRICKLFIIRFEINNFVLLNNVFKLRIFKLEIIVVDY